MKINRLLIIISFAFATLLVSCEDYEDTVVPSPTVSEDNPAVRFAAENITNYEFEPSVTEFNLKVIRSNSTSAIEVPVTVTDNTDESFVIPSSISFAAGEDTVMVTIAINHANATPGKDLMIGIKVDEDYINTYKAEYGEYYAHISILNWQKYATGTYYSAFFDQSFTQDLYRAQDTDKYRFFDLYAVGYNFTFTWDGGKSITPDGELDEDGYYIYVTGFEHPSYGMVTVHIDSSPNWTYYTEETNTFIFDGDWTVAAGSFGWLDDIYTITTTY